MSGCVICGRPTPRRKCRTCEIEERAEERAEADRCDHPECPSCGGATSAEGVVCYRCRRGGDRIETDGGRKECDRCDYLLENGEDDCPYCGADPADADEGNALHLDGGETRIYDPEDHPSSINGLETADDQEARYHARHALQHLEREGSR